jgi:hypothetical protein
MDRAVLDANELVSAFINPFGHPAKVLGAWREGRFELVASPALLGETEEVLNRPRLRKKHGKSPSEVHQWVVDLSRAATMAQDAIELEVVKADPDDDVILACALEGDAGYLVTGDNHLLELKQYRSIRIVTARQFFEHLEEIKER